MKRGRLPLTALRSFEVAGRLGSFSLAAEELHVSQAAISRQIRDLEHTIRRPLFSRRHRGVDLTADGTRLLALLTRSFDEIDMCLSEFAGQSATAELRISVEPSFASCWLLPHLEDFQRVHPEIDLLVDADPKLVEFRSGEAQLAIRSSATKSSWPRTESRHLAHSDMVPVMAAFGLERSMIRDARDLCAQNLLYEENRDLWRAWLAMMGEPSLEPPRGLVYTDCGLVLQAVLRGQGAALIDRFFVADLIKAGKLVQLFEPGIPNGGYWLVARRFDKLSPVATQFVEWITSKLATQTAASNMSL